MCGSFVIVFDQRQGIKRLIFEMAAFDLIRQFDHGPSFFLFNPFCQDRPFSVGTGCGIQFVAVGACKGLPPNDSSLVLVEERFFVQTGAMHGPPTTFEAHNF